MNTELTRLLNWANLEGVDLGRADIDVRYNVVKFWHTRESRDFFRKIKKIVGNFEATGTPPYVGLEKSLTLQEDPEIGWKIRWVGAYECEAEKYTCKMAKFGDDSQPEREDEKVESTV